MTQSDYQKPPPYWAHRVIRAMTKSCATHDIGMDGLALVAIIVHQWDTIRYVRRVSYRIGTLMGLLGVESKQRFYRIEALAIKHGWLQKRTNGTRKPVHYTVHIPPHAMELGDLPTEDGELPEENRTNNGTNTGTNIGEIPLLKPSPNRRDTDTLTGTPSTLYPLPDPLKDREIDPDWIKERQPTPTTPIGTRVPPIEWKKKIKGAGGKWYGKDDEESWQGPIDTYGLEAVLSMMGTMPPAEAADAIKVRDRLWRARKRDRDAVEIAKSSDSIREQDEKRKSILEAANARNQQAYEWMVRIVAYIEKPEAPGAEELRQRILCHHSGPAQIEAVAVGKVNALAVDSILRKIPELRPIAEGKPVPEKQGVA